MGTNIFDADQNDFHTDENTNNNEVLQQQAEQNNTKVIPQHTEDTHQQEIVEEQK
ncbi:hypothetical protein [Paenibacillus sp. L3-i20]|uniref:hypothetical protein n=1 Tax=Paenibacillus sp. L3-i20 TaxID=2905833 RepID=UPI001EE02BAE|nr:hypothetical protein [Paenibacillus sp. L3-i20]GKU76555.1 hypothetical protein L3i20_v209520 [Paenibacillus sp. L3-i20]